MATGQGYLHTDEGNQEDVLETKIMSVSMTVLPHGWCYHHDAICYTHSEMRNIDLLLAQYVSEKKGGKTYESLKKE